MLHKMEKEQDWKQKRQHQPKDQSTCNTYTQDVPINGTSYQNQKKKKPDYLPYIPKSQKPELFNV